MTKAKVELPTIALEHVLRLTDEVGIIQHAFHSLPRREDGYATDDNARALQLVARLSNSDSRLRRSLGERYLAFIVHAFRPAKRGFANFMGFDRRWMEEVGSDDCHGRTLYALATVMATEDFAELHSLAFDLWDQALPHSVDLLSPRAWSSTLLGLGAYATVEPLDLETMKLVENLNQKLALCFRSAATEDWPWFENYLTYGNASLVEGAIVGAQLAGDVETVQTYLASLKWLCDVQTLDSHFVPIGSNGFYPRGQTRARFDQQPIEVDTAILAAARAHRLTEDPYWMQVAELAFAWFLGENDLNLPLYDRRSGGCRDGLHPDRPNQNQGAESTLAYLSAALSIQELRGLARTASVPNLRVL